MGQILNLPNVRLAFPDLFTATDYDNNGKFCYRAQLLVPAGSAVYKLIQKTITEVAEEAFGKAAPSVMKKIEQDNKLKCFIDGDLKEYAGFAGHYALTATRPVDKKRPLLINRDKSPVGADDDVLYAGCFVNGRVEFWPQDNNHGRTVRCTLLGLQFNRSGDPFVTGTQATEDDFEDLGDVGEDEEVPTQKAVENARTKARFSDMDDDIPF